VLGVPLSPAERRHLAAVSVADLSAYPLYLQGRAWHLRAARETDTDTAIVLLRRATAQDPDFARAWAVLGAAYTSRASRRRTAPEWADSAVAAAARAVALDPELAEAHRALGAAHAARGAYDAATTAVEAAVALSPNDAAMLGGLGLLSARRGRYDEAARWLRRAAAAHDAGRPAARAELALIHAHLGDFAGAAQLLQQAMAVQPELPSAKRNLAWLALLQVRHAEAAAHALRFTTGVPDASASLVAGRVFLHTGDLARAQESFERAAATGWDALDLYGAAPVLLGYTLWVRGERAAADSIFAEYRGAAQREIARGSESGALRQALAAVHAVRGERAEAIRLLREAQHHGWTDFYLARQDPLLRSLQADEEFQRIMAENRAELERQRARLAEPAP
jgi:Tfp pilus assembly protein PilF